MSNLTPLFSTIIPCYNSNIQWLAECVTSVIQALSRVDLRGEVIIIDDGSVVSIEDMLHEFIPQDSLALLTFIKKQNGGLSSARNEGIKNARGVYCHFIDDDDIVSVDFFSEMEAEIRKSRPDAIYCDSEFFDDRRKFDFPVTPDHSFASRIILGNCIHVNSVVVKKQLVQALNGFDENLVALEDWDLWLRLIRGGCHFKRVAKILVGVRIHPNSMSRNRARMYSKMSELSIREMREHSAFWVGVLCNKRHVHSWVIAAYTYSFRSDRPSLHARTCLREATAVIGPLYAVVHLVRQAAHTVLFHESSPHRTK